jgi:hypothetical protein
MGPINLANWPGLTKFSPKKIEAETVLVSRLKIIPGIHLSLETLISIFSP